MVAVHVDKVDAIAIENGVVCVSVISEEEVIKWKMPIIVFRKGVALAAQTLAEHDASGKVLQMRKR